MSLRIFSVDECVICMDASATSLFAPCRHKCTCADCSALVREKSMPCPLCRNNIEGIIVEESEHVTSLMSQLTQFMEEREEYLKKLYKPCAKNAGFIGGGKLARSVAGAMGNELERLRTENAGTDRACCKASKITFEEDQEEALLRITYKVGRKTKKETAPLISDWDQVKEELIEDPPTDLVELAAYFPEAFWLCKWHKKPFEELLINNKRRK